MNLDADRTGHLARATGDETGEQRRMYKLPDNLENKYRFVTLAAKRAEQLQLGALPRVASGERKATVIAQEEVAAGLVDVWAPQEEEVDPDLAVEEEEE